MSSGVTDSAVVFSVGPLQAGRGPAARGRECRRRAPLNKYRLLFFSGMSRAAGFVLLLNLKGAAIEELLKQVRGLARNPDRSDAGEICAAQNLLHPAGLFINNLQRRNKLFHVVGVLADADLCVELNDIHAARMLEFVGRGVAW